MFAFQKEPLLLPMINCDKSFVTMTETRRNKPNSYYLTVLRNGMMDVEQNP